MTETPKCWTATTVGEISSAIRCGYTASSNSNPVGPRMLQITDIQEGQVNWSTVPYCEIDKQDAKAFSLEPGDLVFARTGGTVGKSYLIRTVPEPAVFGSYLIKVSAGDGISPAYLYWFFQSLSYWEQIGLKKGGLQGNVNAKTLSSIEIPIAPKNEQDRIVSKIEELFFELDASTESLTHAGAQLKTYRQALLKAAFEGKLTADWRITNPDKLEARDALLRRVRADREKTLASAIQAWQESLRKWRETGEKGRKPAKPPSSPIPRLRPDKSDSNSLPVGWASLEVGSLCEVVRRGSPRPAGDPKYYGGQIPFLKVADLTRTPGIYLNHFTFSITEAGLSKTRMTPPNTLMISNSGATLGVPKICSFEATFNDGIAAFIGIPEAELEFHYFFGRARRLN
jgi:type I restriction enzyme S subunit